jgi:hypothetical protein
MAWDEEADEEWVEDEPGDGLLECPSCREAVHEDTQQCPYCGDWITPVYPGGRSKRWAWAAVAILLILSIALWAVL